LGTGVALSKGCVLGLGVVLPNDINLEASILVASPMQNKESLDQDEGKLFCLKVTIGLPLFHTKEESGFITCCFLKRETDHVHLH
jgi:hypothetical protein